MLSNTFAEEMAVAVPGSVDLSVLPPDLRSLPEHCNRHRRAPGGEMNR
jgi:hypothetical protein